MPRNTIDPGAKARTAARRLKVMEYRKAGMPFRAIAQRLSMDGEQISHVMVQKDFTRVMRDLGTETQAEKAEMVAMENERLDMARLAIIGKVVAGDIGACRMWIKISESYRRLHGLDKPFRIEDITPPKTEYDFSQLTLEEKLLLEELLSRSLVRNSKKADRAGNNAEGDDLEEEDDY